MAERECKYCQFPLNGQGMTVPMPSYVATHELRYVFCNDTCYQRWRYAVPLSAIEIDGMEYALIGYSELAMHTGHAGSFVHRLWAVNEGTYGYATLKPVKGKVGFLHGCLNIHDQHNISLS